MAEIYVVRVSVPVEEFRELLRQVPGAALVRELPPDRVVVSLSSAAAVPELSTLEGVEAVAVDRLEHLDRD